MEFEVGDRVAAPVCITSTKHTATRSRYGYDLGEVIATGKSKKSGEPAVKVRFPAVDSIWVRKLTTEPFMEKRCLSKDVDKV